MLVLNLHLAYDPISLVVCILDQWFPNCEGATASSQGSRDVLQFYIFHNFIQFADVDILQSILCLFVAPLCAVCMTVFAPDCMLPSKLIRH